MPKPVQLNLFVSRMGRKVKGGVRNTILAPNTRIAEIREVLLKEKKVKLAARLANAQAREKVKLARIEAKARAKLEVQRKKLQIRADKISAYELAWRVIDGKVASTGELIHEAWGIVRILSPPKKDRKDRHGGFHRVFDATAENPKELGLARLTSSRANKFISEVNFERRRIRAGLPYNL